MKPISITIHHDGDGIFSVQDGDGHFMSRETVNIIIKDIQRFYQRLSDEEIDLYIQWSRKRSRPQREKQRKGYVYLIKSYDDFYKIGQARDPHIRLSGLQLPYKPKLIHTIFVSDMDWAEQQLHDRFAMKRVDGEWFNLSSADVSYIRSLRSLEPDP